MLYQAKDINKDLDLETEICIIGSGFGGGVLAKELTDLGFLVTIIEEESYNLPEFPLKPFQTNGLITTKDMGLMIDNTKGVGGLKLNSSCLSIRPEKAVIDRWRQELDLEFSYFDVIHAIEKLDNDLRTDKIPESKINLNNQLFREGCKKLGLKTQVVSHNGKDCFCENTSTKNNLLISNVASALEYYAEIYTEAKAQRILFDTIKRKATGVLAEVINPITRKKHKLNIKARIVVCAMGAINTPALMLKSQITNKGENIGKGLHLNPYLPVLGFFDKEIHGSEGFTQSLYCDDFAEFKNEGYGGFMMNPSFENPSFIANIVPSFGKEHWEIMKDYSKMTYGVAMIHDETEGSISIDKYGKPQIDYWSELEEQKTILQGIKTLAKVYLAVGAKKVLIPFKTPLWINKESELSILDNLELKPKEVTLMSCYPQGTCKMGNNPTYSVVNNIGEVHEVQGLFIADASIYPTSLGMPPQTTSIALGVLLAKNIIKNGRRLLQDH